MIWKKRPEQLIFCFGLWSWTKTSRDYVIGYWVYVLCLYLGVCSPGVLWVWKCTESHLSHSWVQYLYAEHVYWYLNEPFSQHVRPGCSAWSQHLDVVSLVSSQCLGQGMVPTPLLQRLERESFLFIEWGGASLHEMWGRTPGTARVDHLPGLTTQGTQQGSAYSWADSFPAIMDRLEKPRNVMKQTYSSILWHGWQGVSFQAWARHTFFSARTQLVGVSTLCGSTVVFVCLSVQIKMLFCQGVNGWHALAGSEMHGDSGKMSCSINPPNEKAYQGRSIIDWGISLVSHLHQIGQYLRAFRLYSYCKYPCIMRTHI